MPVPVAYLRMAFGPHIPKINFCRSIGVAANFAGLAGDSIVVTLRLDGRDQGGGPGLEGTETAGGATC